MDREVNDNDTKIMIIIRVSRPMDEVTVKYKQLESCVNAVGEQ